ncbi:hypothetical protein [Nocardia rosealba]|uniref:hypothetical protein n=1 Tax=Nocardia rosealba TaxID=2878563 RepID=UPI001CD98847|nr:hypothetical protein [Nocardia rosealba]MCA2210816.1 hypothetical protein [Nocardia rosealba]
MTASIGARPGSHGGADRGMPWKPRRLPAPCCGVVPVLRHTALSDGGTTTAHIGVLSLGRYSIAHPEIDGSCCGAVRQGVAA